MTLFTAEKITKAFSGKVVLADASFVIREHDRIGVVGKNGSGKTTLFDIVAGRIGVDSGDISRSKTCRVDYIEQDKTEYFDLPLFEYVLAARQDLLDLRQQIHDLQYELSMVPHDHDRLSRMGQLQSRFEHEGGFTLESETTTVLNGLGFDPERHRERVRNFSGGEKNRAGLARALAGSGNLLLLDEPTNHLDIESTRWLEEYLRATDRTYLIISHDRAFLSATVDRIWEINHGRLDFYVGTFERYLQERHERRRRYEHEFQHQRQEIERIEEFVRRNMAGQKTRQAQSKLKYLGRIKRLPPPRSDSQTGELSVRSSGRSYAHVLAVNDVTVGYGDHAVLRDVRFDLYRGEKVGLIGRNGSGKTTLLKILTGELSPMAGDVRLGANVDVAYFDQELSDLDEAGTVLDSVWEMDWAAEIGKIRSYIARFGFTGEDCFKVVAALSGGEKTKLSLARLLYHPANFLILDEPTNHLDLDSREVLEKALQEFDGSCIIVSHDRYFLDQVVGRIFHLDDEHLRIFEGNYKYYTEKTAPVELPPRIKDPGRKQAFLAFKAESKRTARHKRQVESARKRIADLEREIQRLDDDIRTNIPRTDWEGLHEASQRRHQLEEQLLELYATLEKLDHGQPD
ncbi:MAG TPA: ABC-F family ATP-binding cassette domain-containing protein [Candidatus Deferrimicrobium sp.]|nr:ABC-F family ATP-binding cassette domain-containing protein [Candidatus Deferrimicrobium sp.]